MQYKNNKKALFIEKNVVISELFVTLQKQTTNY